MKEILKHIKKRATNETPDFFKKIRDTSIIIAGIGGIVLSLPIAWPAWVVSAITIIVSVCTSIAGTSQLTVKNNNISNEFDMIIRKNKKGVQNNRQLGTFERTAKPFKHK